MEDYKNKYEDLLDTIKDLYPNMTKYQQEKLQGVCPDLTESEDEKIRNYVIDGLKFYANAIDDEEGLNNALSWLEKQKPTEEVNAKDCRIEGINTAVDILETTLGKVEGYQSDDGILEHKAAIVAVKKMKEQKPTREYSSLEITSVVRKALQECEDFRNYRPDVYAARVGATVELLLNKQKPVEKWSEEDENAIVVIQDIIRYSDKIDANIYTNELKGKLYSWLNNLKPQSEQNWSKEDENTRNKIIGSLDALKFYVEGNKNFDTDRIKSNLKELNNEVEWLQNIKPQSHWKPSKEQVEYLRHGIELFRRYASYCPVCLLELYEDLKKL